MKTTLALLILLCAAGCIEGAPRGPGPSTRIDKLFGGPDNVDLVASPERVEAVKLRRPARDQESKPYNQWAQIGAPVRVPDDLASRFGRGLTSQSTYPRGDAPKACDPVPGYMLRFTAYGRSVEVCFCFECNILFTYRGSESIWYANFDESEKEIAALFLKVFPADEDLRRIAAKENP